MADLTVNLSDLPEFFNGEAARLRDPDFTPALKVVRQLIVSASRDAFNDAADPVDGSPWPPLAESTVKSRRKGKGKGSAKPLLDTTRLRSSVTTLGEGHLENLTPRSVEVGTNLLSKKGFPYPVVHQKGGARVPRRRFLGIGPALADRIAQVIADYAVKLLSRGRR